MAYFKEIAQITPSLFLSGAAAITANKIISLGITQVINATLEVPDVYVQGVKVHRIALEDSPKSKLGQYFDKAADLIHHEETVCGGRTLVHCVMGVSRSSSIVIAYLMKYHCMTLKDAYFHVKQARPVIRPNYGFFKQLIGYERQLRGENSVKMVNSALGMVPDIYAEHTENLLY